MHAEVRVSRGVLDAIGRTPIVELRRVVPAGSARILAKLESANPTGSMKDRMAKAVVEAAEADGRLPPGGTVVAVPSGERMPVASWSWSVTSTPNDTGVSRAKWVNSTGCTASNRTEALTCTTSQIAGTMNSSSFKKNWNACT